MIFEEPNKLSDDDKKLLSIIRQAVQQIIGKVREPMDPKILAMLEMVSDMVAEQIVMDKHYDWAGCSSCGEPIDDDEEEDISNSPYSFFTEEQEEIEGGEGTPSADDLARWFKDD